MVQLETGGSFSSSLNALIVVVVGLWLVSNWFIRYSVCFSSYAIKLFAVEVHY